MEQSFKDFFYQYFDKLHAYAHTIVLDNAEAKDIVQHAFIKLWERRSAINLQNDGARYIYRAVYNLSLNAVRNKATRDKHNASLTASNVYSIRHYVEEKELAARLTSGIENLPEKCREVFKKSRYDGLKYAEIANAMGISIKTVEVHMTKALKMLKEQFSDLAIILFAALISIINKI